MKSADSAQAGEWANAPIRCQANPSRRILVVDDDPVIRCFCARVLVGSGYHVDEAEDGAAGWEALQANSYDLVITDHNMPKLTGVELIKKLRCAGMTLPVILATGQIPTEELAGGPSLQIAATLLKPLTIRELVGTVNSVLQAPGSSPEICAPEMAGAASHATGEPGPHPPWLRE